MNSSSSLFSRFLKKEVLSSITIVLICVIGSFLDISGLGTDAWFVIGVIGLMFVFLLFDIMPAHYAMLLTLSSVMFSQIITTEEALQGFSSSAVLSVAVLYVVAAGLTATGGLNYFMNKLLGTPKGLASAQLRLIVPVALISAFMNNTPVVAIMIPILQQWAPKANLPVSQLFIPLSFASILGGACTLIGTSTNLVVAGKAETDLNYKIGLFDLAVVGVPALFTGICYIILFSPFLLPDAAKTQKRARNLSPQNEAFSNYSAQVYNSGASSPFIGSQFDRRSVFDNIAVACSVNPSSPAVNKTVTSAQLRGLSELYLTSVQRNDNILQAIGPEFVINAFDILFFTGIVDNFASFCQTRGFTPVTDDNEEMFNEYNQNQNDRILPFDSRQRSKTLEGHVLRVKVRPSGSLAGHTPSDINFRRTYRAAIISISCCKTKITGRGNLGRRILKANDELVILVSEDFSWDSPETSRDLELKTSQSTRNQPRKSFEREFLISMRVSESSGMIGVTSLVGKNIINAGLRGLPGLFLIALERESIGILRAVGSDEILEKDDILWFIGERNAFNVLRQIPGLVSATNQDKKLKLNKVDRRLVECVVSLDSDMLGKTIREVRFRSRFRAAVVAVHRQGQRVLKKIGDIELKAGDVLLLDTGPYFLQRFRDDRNFLLVAEIENSGVPQFGKFYIALGLVIGMMGLYTLLQSLEDVEASLFECAIVASAIMVMLNILSPTRAMKSINWEVIIAIACAFGLSTALEESGVAETIGNSLVDLSEYTGTGEFGLLVAIYLATFLVSIVVANNAAALLMFPIAVQALATLPRALPCAALGFADDSSNETIVEESTLEDDTELNCVRKVLYVLMLAASSSFSSPFGYQTNLMVYGPGNYRFSDFLKFGLPMQFWQMIFSVIFVEFIDSWYISWAAAFSFFVAVLFVKLCLSKKQPVVISRLSSFNDLGSEAKKERELEQHHEVVKV